MSVRSGGACRLIGKCLSAERAECRSLKSKNQRKTKLRNEAASVGGLAVDQRDPKGATAMSKLHFKLGTGIGFVLLSSAALAASESEQTLTTVTNIFMYVFILFVVVVG